MKFSKIFKKYIGTGEAGRMVDDIGAFRNVVGIRGYDPETLETISDVKVFNTVTNLSRSTIIRLLGLGTSPWSTGALNPYDLAIASMRFGVNSASVPEDERKYLYYDIAEESKFDVVTLGGTGVGGDVSKASYGAGYSPNGVATEIVKRNTQASDGYTKIEASGASGSTHRYKTYPLLVSKTPPSQFTVKIDFMSGGGVLETAYFNSAHNWLGAGSKIAVPPYVRAASGSPVTKIVTKTGGQQVLFRGDAALEWNIDPYATSRPGATMLYYDAQDSTWKILVDEHNAASYETMRVSFMRGKHNVINNVVPKVGVNKGFGTSVADRYSSTSGDAYNVVATREYRDCDTDFIDDFSVMFAINMTASDGNGNASAEQNQSLLYTQGYLFNGRGEMFANIQLSPDNAFEKNSKFAYYITWQLLAPIN